MSYGANIRSVGFSSGVGLGRVIFNTDHNNGLTCIMAPQGTGTKRKLMCSELLHKGENEGLGKKAESSASWDSFAASTLCNFTLTARFSQARYFFNL